MSKLIVGSALAALAAGALALAVVAGGGQEAEPPPPAWVSTDGKVDPTKLPERVNVAGPDGDLVRCSNGRLLAVRPPSGSPPTAPVRGVPAAQEAEPIVPRCGTGPDAHLNPIWVPVSRDPLRGG